MAHAALIAAHDGGLNIAAGAAPSLCDIRVTNTNGRSCKGSDLFKWYRKAPRSRLLLSPRR
jgi:hypothetical protein